MTKFYILMLLHEKKRHGYQIIEEIRKRTGKKPSAGQVYPLLKRFQKLGYVTLAKSSGIKKTYEITAKGRSFASDILSKFSDMLELAIRKKITACAHCRCEIYKGAYKAKVSGRTASFCCASCWKSFMR